MVITRKTFEAATNVLATTVTFISVAVFVIGAIAISVDMTDTTSYSGARLQVSMVGP